MTEYEQVWNCHECGAGPYLLGLAEQCVEANCNGHYRCGNCRVQWVVKEPSTGSPATLSPHVFHPTDSRTFRLHPRTLVNASSMVAIFPQGQSIHDHRRSNSSPTLYRQKDNKRHVVNHDHTVLVCCECSWNFALGDAHNEICDNCTHRYCSNCSVETVKSVCRPSRLFSARFKTLTALSSNEHYDREDSSYAERLETEETI
jgi:hypothetical protein